MKTHDARLKLPEADLYLFGRGEARQAYNVFGCHKIGQAEDPDTSVYRFVLWAPHAKSVALDGGPLRIQSASLTTAPLPGGVGL